MDATIPIPFALGEQVWWIGNGSSEEWVTCPECAGTKAITMVLGNGEQVSVACENCSAGFEPSRGVVKQTIYLHAPVPFTPRRVHVDGEEVRYSESGQGSTYYNSADAKNLFATKEECQRRCDELNVEKAKEKKDLAWQILIQNRKKMAYSAHYWTQMVSRLRKELAAAEARLQVVKAKKEEA